MGGDGTDNGSFDIRQAGCVIEAPREVCLDEIPLCVVPGGEAFSDTCRTITESDISCRSTGIAKLSESLVFLDFQKCPWDAVSSSLIVIPLQSRGGGWHGGFNRIWEWLRGF